MSDCIAINTEEALELAQEFEVLAEQLAGLMDSLEISSRSAQEHWRGDAFTRFAELFELLRPEMRKFESLCATLHASLQTVSEQFDTLDAQMASWFQ